MKRVITGLTIQVELTQYNDDNKVAGRVMARDGKPPLFSIAEADIPDAVVEWIYDKIGKEE